MFRRRALIGVIAATGTAVAAWVGYWTAKLLEHLGAFGRIDR